MANNTEILKTWLGMNDYIKNATEAQVKNLLDHEKKVGKRLSFMLRLYGKYSTLRRDREQRELERSK